MLQTIPTSAADVRWTTFRSEYSVSLFRCWSALLPTPPHRLQPIVWLAWRWGFCRWKHSLPPRWRSCSSLAWSATCRSTTSSRTSCGWRRRSTTCTWLGSPWASAPPPPLPPPPQCLSPPPTTTPPSCLSWPPPISTGAPPPSTSRCLPLASFPCSSPPPPPPPPTPLSHPHFQVQLLIGVWLLSLAWCAVTSCWMWWW